MSKNLDYLQPILNQLFSKTFQHPVIGKYVEWVPVNWLQRLANPHAGKATDLGTWVPDAPLVGLEELYQNMLVHGMRDPFLIGVGRNDRRIRLEAGNHRVQVLQSKGILIAPAVAYIGDTAISHEGNGVHPGEVTVLKLPLVPRECQIMGPYPIKEYAKLSEVLMKMPDLAD